MNIGHDPMRVTTRQVPISCAVCGGRKAVMEDEDEDEWISCPACKGQGWLMVTETITERALHA